MNIEHPFLRYAKALVKIECEKEDITIDDCRDILKQQMDFYRLIPTESYEGKETVKFIYASNDCIEGKKTPYTKNYGIFLAPNVILEDSSANGTWAKLTAIDKEFDKKKSKTTDALLSTTAVAGDYIKFSERGGKGKVVPKIDYENYLLLLISVITDKKPCLQYYLGNSNPKNEVRYNACIIPDLEDNEMCDFIKLFKRLKINRTKDLFIGNVLPPGGTGTNKRINYEAKRPQIFKGNFPNPPRSSALGSIALLGAIGEFAKEAEVSDLAQTVLDSLKEATMYMIKYGDAQAFTYNHHVIDLAKEGNLRKMVDAVYYSVLYKHGKRNRSDLKPQDKNASLFDYQKFDLFSSRFLQLFNAPAFQDFLAFRAEYLNELELLFKTYFIKMENIPESIVTSARFLGEWLNNVAYFSAVENTEKKQNEPDKEYKEKVRKEKAKFLASMESTALSVKDGKGHELISRVVTIAGRLSYQDAPSEAGLFMEKTTSGDITVEQARNMIIAFSRLRGSKSHENNGNDLSGNNDKEQSDVL